MKLENLRAALAATTPGSWGVDSETHVTVWSFGVGRCGCRSIAHTGHKLVGQPQSPENSDNAHFIAMAHNLMPKLLDAVALLDFEISDGGMTDEMRARALTLLEQLS